MGMNRVIKNRIEGLFNYVPTTRMHLGRPSISFKESLRLAGDHLYSKGELIRIDLTTEGLNENVKA